MTDPFMVWKFSRGPLHEEWEGIYRVDYPGRWDGFQKRWRIWGIPLTWWRKAGTGL